VAVDAVIFDWGGTLTPWKTMDGRGWWRIAAELAAAGLVTADRVDEVGALLNAAEEETWRRSREEHRSGTLAEILAVAGLTPDDAIHAIHAAEWDWATYLDPEAPALLGALRERDIRVGILSNTVWPRSRHEQIFVRDGIDHLIDGAVYTCEIPWTKPHPMAFRAAMEAVGAADPARCVFVGDRPFDDIYGARQAGMRAVLLPHSEIPDVQRGHTDGEPDAVIARLADLVAVVDAWR
jgi:putative hydrolase of the HAD superfamily